MLVLSNQHIIRNEFFTTLLICSIKVPTANSVFVELWLLEDYSLPWLSRSNEGLRITGFFSICLLPRCMIPFLSEIKNRLCKIENSIRQFCGVRWVWDSTIHWLITCGVYFLTIPNYQGNTVSFDALSKSKIIFRVIHWLDFLPQGLYLMFFVFGSTIGLKINFSTFCALEF